MTKNIQFLFFLFLIGAIPANAYSQDRENLMNKRFLISDQFIRAQITKSEKFKDKVNRGTVKYLDKLYRKEQFLKTLVRKIDPSAADALFNNADATYSDLKRRLTDGRNISPAGDVYNGYLDSMKTVFKFVENFSPDSSSKQLNRKIDQALQAYDKVQTTLDQTHAIQEKLSARAKFLEGKLGDLGLKKSFAKYQSDLIYYKAQLHEYRGALENPSKAEAKLLKLVSNIPAFKSFFKKYSQLGSLFNLPGEELNAESIAGLQTRSMVMEQLGGQMGSAGNAVQQVNTGILNAQSNLSSTLKNRLNTAGGSSDLDMPDFKLNDQKTKSVWKRLEFGINLQSVKSNFYFPTTTDIGTSVGYKIRSNILAGVGASYKIGWGKDFRHIAITHQGVGLRTYMEMKLKGSFWMTGGGELNYRSSFADIDQLQDYSQWQKSALVGLSKKYKVNKKLKGNLQLLYDFLHRSQIPSSQALKFRVGYNFN